MDEKKPSWREERDEFGIAPPYGAYRWHYSNYEEAQYGSLGSGLMGGWTSVSLGGSFDDARERDPERDH